MKIPTPFNRFHLQTPETLFCGGKVPVSCKLASDLGRQNDLIPYSPAGDPFTDNLFRFIRCIGFCRVKQSNSTVERVIQDLKRLFSIDFAPECDAPRAYRAEGKFGVAQLPIFHDDLIQIVNSASIFEPAR